jgi:hypothetical protein
MRHRGRRQYWGPEIADSSFRVTMLGFHKQTGFPPKPYEMSKIQSECFVCAYARMLITSNSASLSVPFPGCESGGSWTPDIFSSMLMIKHLSRSSTSPLPRTIIRAITMYLELLHVFLFVALALVQAPTVSVRAFNPIVSVIQSAVKDPSLATSTPNPIISLIQSASEAQHARPTPSFL